jgi:hypothetical protein
LTELVRATAQLEIMASDGTNDSHADERRRRSSTQRLGADGVVSGPELRQARTIETEKKKKAKKSAPAQGGNVSQKVPEAPGAGLDASRRFQGQYLGLLKKIPEERRGAYKEIARLNGREKAIKMMEHHLGIT